MKIVVKFRDPGRKLEVDRAGFAINWGAVAIYPDLKKADCTIIPLDLIEEVTVQEGPEEEQARKDSEKVVPFRGN